MAVPIRQEGAVRRALGAGPIEANIPSPARARRIFPLRPVAGSPQPATPQRSTLTRLMKVRMTRKLGFRLCLLIVVCLALPLLAGCEERKQAAAPPATPAVDVRPAAMKGVTRSFEFVGRIKAVDKVEVRARVEGFLEKVLFREGQDVKAGDLLYQIEKVQFQAQVDQAKANLA